MCAAWGITHSGFSHADAEARRSVLTALACATLVTQWLLDPFSRQLRGEYYG